jgi:sugar-phosphatase
MIETQALLFDLDGVLINSVPAVVRAWTRWAQTNGLDPHKVLHGIHGRPSIASIRELLPDADHVAENRILEQAEIDDIEGIVPLPGVRELLAALPAERWAIVTSCTRRLALVRLRAAGLPLPGTLVTATDIEQGKPHPEPYQKGAAGLGFVPQQCIVFEDALAGIASGKAAGARVIAFTTTTSVAELHAARPDWMVKDASAVRVVSREQGLLLALEEVRVPAGRDQMASV